MNTRRAVPKLEFYITNVCNLTCQGCNRFNDLNFRGWQKWKDHEQTIAAWAEKIDVGQIVIMGGEPLLNPDIKQWVLGLNRIWQKSVQVLTNGTYIDRIPDLYKVMTDNPSGNNAWIGVSLHDLDDRDGIYRKIRKFFGKPVIEIDDPTQTRLGGCKTFQDPDNDQFFVEVWDQHEFKPNALVRTPEGRLTLHQNRPEDAFNICAFQHHKNYHFIRGKIYRCGPVALFPELDDQFDLDLTPEDKRLIRSYRPLSIDEYDSRGDDFFQHIDDMIPQCKFCSADNRYHRLHFVQNKKD